jgi:integration host factor subunit beta
MIKSELVERVATHNPHLYRREIENVVNAILEEIEASQSRRDRVGIRGFGVFSVRNRPAHTGRNPCSSASVEITQKFTPLF